MVGNVKSGALWGCGVGLGKLGSVSGGLGVECDGVEELQLRAPPTRASTAIIRVTIIKEVFDILLAILVTSWHKPAKIVQVTGQHQNSYADKEYRGYYGDDKGMAIKPSDVS